MRLAVYFAALLAAILVPLGLVTGAALLGPDPYVLVRQVGGEWSEPRRFGDGSVVSVTDHGTPGEAQDAAWDLVDTIPSTSTGRLFQVTRYLNGLTGEYGLIMPIDRYLLHITAPEEDVLERRLAALDFVAENENRNIVWVGLTRHVDWIAPVAFAYCLAWCFLMARGGAWATRLDPEPATHPASGEELRRSLLALDRLGQPFSVTQIGPARLRVEWRLDDLGWIKAMSAAGMRKGYRIDLDLDEKRRLVRAVDTTHRIKWGQGPVPFSSRFAFFRSLVMAPRERDQESGLEFDRSRGWRMTPGHSHRFSVGEMKSPLIQAVLRSGWRWQPVLSFFRPLGG